MTVLFSLFGILFPFSFLYYITKNFSSFLLVWIEFLPWHTVMHVCEYVFHLWLPCLSSLYCVKATQESYFQLKSQYIGIDQHKDFRNYLFWLTHKQTTDAIKDWSKIDADLIFNWKIKSIGTVSRNVLSESNCGGSKEKEKQLF